MYSFGWMCSSIGEDNSLIGVISLDCELRCATSGEIIRAATQVIMRDTRSPMWGSGSVSIREGLYRRLPPVSSARKDGDSATLLSALRMIARVKGISEMAKEIGMTRQGLHRALSAKGNPRLDNINAIMRAMGYQLMPQKTEILTG